MTGLKYVLRGKMGYQCDSEWDGDTFTKSPENAWVYDEPVRGGRISETYECVKILFWEEKVTEHSIYIRYGIKKGKIRFRAICKRCGVCTNSVANEQSAMDRVALFSETCVITKHIVNPDNSVKR